jgi:hypothetical protein
MSWTLAANWRACRSVRVRSLPMRAVSAVNTSR